MAFSLKVVGKKDIIWTYECKNFFASLFVNSIIPFWTSSFKTSIFIKRYCHRHKNYENNFFFQNTWKPRKIMAKGRPILKFKHKIWK